ncbi:putative uDP-N-acetylmuramoylalanine--D-glutamate ligase [Mycobacterium xenopi 3993]|nr:putative uDP-N-acetylmuramoylalanine--D-glutamate ligase [Mycobacterium xenopi 3993]
MLDALGAAALARCVGVPGRRSPARWRHFALAGTAPRWSPSSTASATSTTPRPPTRTRPRPRRWPIRGWCGSPVVCSRVPRSTRPSPGSQTGWSERF